MRFERLTTIESPLYARAMELYGCSFPLHEQRLPASQIKIMGCGEYQFNLCRDGQTLAGILLCWETARFIYVEHFCIFPELRGKSYGRQALELLSARGKPVILEIDPPVDPVSIRRKAFYERAHYTANDFPHVHPPYRAGYAGHPLVVMSCPGPLSQAAYEDFSRYLRERVMGV